MKCNALRILLILIFIISIAIQTGMSYAAVDRFLFMYGGDIYIVNSDGTGIINLTGSSGIHEREAALSPDGNRVVFTSDQLGREEIFVMNSDGTDITQITNGIVGVFDLSWSPDGTHIAFTAKGNDSPDIFILNIDNTNLTNITNSLDYESWPRWSPNTDLIAFTSDRDGSSELYTIEPSGDNYTRLTSLHLGDEIARTHSPAWSPDGTMIAFGALGQLFRIHPDGTDLTNIGEDGNTSPIWFGNEVIVYRLIGEEWVAINVDGTNRQLVNLPWPEDFYDLAFPSDWQPSDLLPANPPTAVAGPDQTVTADSSGFATVILDSTGSTIGDGKLYDMRWQWDDHNILSLITIPQVEVSLGVGVHTITLYIQNTRYLIATDTVTVTVEAAQQTPMLTPTPLTPG